jgi:hypothetical protein
MHSLCNDIRNVPFKLLKELIEIHKFDLNLKSTDNMTPINLALETHFANIPTDLLMYLLNQPGVKINENSLLLSACKNIQRLPLHLYQFLIETLGGDINPVHFGCINPFDTAFTLYCVHIQTVQISPSDHINTVISYLLQQCGIDTSSHLPSVLCSTILSSPEKLVQMGVIRNTKKFLTWLTSQNDTTLLFPTIKSIFDNTNLDIGDIFGLDCSLLHRCLYSRTLHEDELEHDRNVFPLIEYLILIVIDQL